MTTKSQLNPKILDFLHDRLGKTTGTIRKDLSVLRRTHPGSTLNAVAKIYAEQHGESLRRLLGKDDKLTLPGVTVAKPIVVKRREKASNPKRMKTIIQLDTDDIFLKKHIHEINRAFTANCNTCVFVLIRKVFENLIVRVLRSKFPKNPELYFDISKSRNLDFSNVLDNLYKKRDEFDIEQKEAIERLNQKLKPFKNDANDKAHSLYHIVENQSEVEEWNLDTIMGLISELM